MSRHKKLSGTDLMNIRQMYVNNVSYGEIADTYGVCIKTIQNHIDVMIKLGQVNKRVDVPGRRKILSQTEKKKPTPTKRYKGPMQGDGWIRCTKQVALTCRYGCMEYSAHSNYCNYILATGHSRGCPWEYCTKYEKVTEDAPRLYHEAGLEIFNPNMKKGRKKKWKN